MSGEPIQVKFKAQDRVKRANVPGCLGVVKEIKVDVMATPESREKGVMIGVLWDNGTLSYLAPHCLVEAK